LNSLLLPQLSLVVVYHGPYATAFIGRSIVVVPRIELHEHGKEDMIAEVLSHR
jgi:hypothetical protein